MTFINFKIIIFIFILLSSCTSQTVNKYSVNNSTNHLQFGQLMSKYLERMSKCNDQILKLAELIAKEQEAAENISDDAIFAKIME